jgi:hypothetical protein
MSERKPWTEGEFVVLSLIVWFVALSVFVARSS